jgi:hypothetical protein
MLVHGERPLLLLIRRIDNRFQELKRADSKIVDVAMLTVR